MKEKIRKEVMKVYDQEASVDEVVDKLLVLFNVSNRPCFGVVEMAVHDFFTSHNSFQEITDQEGESYTMEFLEAHKEWLGISDDC